MENFKITVDNEDYIVEQHQEIKALFYVRHWSGVHKLARREDASWQYVEHELLAHGFDLERVASEIEKNLN